MSCLCRWRARFLARVGWAVAARGCRSPRRSLEGRRGQRGLLSSLRRLPEVVQQVRQGLVRFWMMLVTLLVLERAQTRRRATKQRARATPSCGVSSGSGSSNDTSAEKGVRAEEGAPRAHTDDHAFCLKSRAGAIPLDIAAGHREQPNKGRWMRARTCDSWRTQPLRVRIHIPPHRCSPDSNALKTANRASFCG